MIRCGESYARAAIVAVQEMWSYDPGIGVVKVYASGLSYFRDEPDFVNRLCR